VIEKLRHRLQAQLRRGPSALEHRVHDALAERNARRTSEGDAPWFASPEDRTAPPGILNRGSMLALAFDFLYGNMLDGDYLEFGSHTARTFRLAWRAHERHAAVATRFFLFDSFEGLPEPKGIDRHPKWQGGRLASSADEVVATADAAGIPRERYELVPGYYEESLTPAFSQSLVARGVKAGIVYVDCDLYESAKLALEFVVPLLQSGTIVCFDDWFTFEGRPDRGEQRAAAEFLEAHAELSLVEYAQFGWHGKSFIVHLHG
jgi:hypothetical protein